MSRRTPYAYTGSRLGRCHLGTRSAAQGHVGDIRRFHHGLAHDLKDLGAAVDMDGQESSRKRVHFVWGGEAVADPGFPRGGGVNP